MGLNHSQIIIPHRLKLVLVAKKAGDCCPTPFLMTTLLPDFSYHAGSPPLIFYQPPT